MVDCSLQNMETLSDREKFKRLLYLTDVGPSYIAGDPQQHFLKDINTKLDFISNVVKDHETFFIDTLKQASNDELLPRRVTLLYVLAFALTIKESHESNDARNRLALTAVDISKNDEEFFKFISIFTKLNKLNTKNRITTAVGGAFNSFLENKTSWEYAQAVSKAKGYHSWQYKDLIKLSHYKSKCIEKTLITAYVLFGLDKLMDSESEEIKKIYHLVQKWDLLRKTKDEVVTANLVKELQANFSHVNPKFIKSHVVWAAIIPQIPVREVLRLLPKFYRYGMLKEKSLVHTKVVEALSSLQRVKDCKLEPMEVITFMRDFEKGGKAMDPKLEAHLKSRREVTGDAKERIAKFRAEPKCSIILGSIDKCLRLSYPKDMSSLNLGKRIVLVLDITQTEPVCFKNKNFTCLEAELALTLHYLKTEKNVNVAVYQNRLTKGFNLDKGATFAQSLQKLKDNKSEYMLFSSVFDWAMSKKKEVDLFICFVQTMNSLQKAPKEVRRPGWNSVKDGLLKYQTKMSLASTKVVVISPGAHNLAGFDGSNALTICGFCPEIPKVIRAFVKGTFS